MKIAPDAVKRRVPRQERAEQRVAGLLEAAAAEIAAVGYEAATMTAIAERAGASIGAVYQYFPNKEAVVRALRDQYGNQMEQRWSALGVNAAQLSVEQLVERIFDLMVLFMEEHPAYIPLLSAPLAYSRDPQARDRLREHFAQLFRQRQPQLAHDHAFRMANVTLQLVKGLNQLYGDARPKERKLLVLEFKLAVAAYLNLGLTPAPAATLHKE
jgi:AcrR family transcriptional regulator